MTVSRIDFVQAFLTAIPRPLTHSNELAWLALSVNEYGSTSNFGAIENLFDSTQPEPGSTPFNSNGGDPVQDYVSMSQGVSALRETVTNGRYEKALELMAAQDPAAITGQIAQAQAILAALTAGGWGSINLALVPQTQADWAMYAALVVSGGENVDPPTAPTTDPSEEDDMKAIIASGSKGGEQIIAADCQTKVPCPEGDVAAVLLASGNFVDLRGKLDPTFVDSIPVST